MAWISRTGDSIANTVATDYGTIPFEKFRVWIPIILMNIISYCASALFLISALPGMAQDPSQKQRLGTEFGISAFERECTKCHGNAAVERAPSPAAIRQMPPERIYTALTTGVMQTQAANLSDEQKRRLAEYMGGRPLGSAALGDASQMPNHCPAEATLPDPAKSPAWNGWGVDVGNSRFQDGKAAGITPAQIPGLKLKWAFGFPLGVSAFGQPSVAAGRVFVGSDIGYVYSLDMRTGCVYWSYQTKAAVRTAITIGPTGAGELVSIRGLSRRHAGQCLCARRRVGRPAVDQAGRGSFQRAHHRGSDALPGPALRARLHLRRLLRIHARLSMLHLSRQRSRPERRDWRSDLEDVYDRGAETNEEELDRHTTMGAVRRGGVELPHGGRQTPGHLFRNRRLGNRAGAGNIRLDYGGQTWTPVSSSGIFRRSRMMRLWAAALERTRTENCPDHPGPDWDFGASPILKTLPSGRDLLLAPNKSGIVFALDPDHNGAVIWKTDVCGEEGNPQHESRLGRRGGPAEPVRGTGDWRDHRHSICHWRKGLDDAPGAAESRVVVCGGE